MHEHACNKTIIEEDDLADVMEEVFSIKSLYYSLGRALKLKVANLKAIREAHQHESDADYEQALEEMLLLWLNKEYNVVRFGHPTWRLLVQAVDMESGGNSPDLAKKIAFKHPAG